MAEDRCRQNEDGEKGSEWTKLLSEQMKSWSVTEEEY